MLILKCYVFIWKSILIINTPCQRPVHPCGGPKVPLSGTGTINALHKKQNHFEWAVKQKDFNFRKSDMNAVNYNFEVMMYLKNVREEHVVTYREAVKATRDPQLVYSLYIIHP